MTEQNLLDACLRYMKTLKQSGEPIEWRKVHGSGYSSGEPDLDIVWAGRSIKVELKVGTNQPTPLQLRRLAAWKAAGATAEVARTLNEFVAILNAGTM